MGVQSTAAEVAECARLGFTEQAIAHSNTLLELGPRGTLSDEGRLLRWCSYMRTPEQERANDELSREERWRSWNAEDRWPLPYDKSCEYAVALNEQAMQMAKRNLEAR